MIGYTPQALQLQFTAGVVDVQVQLHAQSITFNDILVQADRPISAASSRAVREFHLQI